MQDVRHVLYLSLNLRLNPNSQTFAQVAGDTSARGWNATTVAVARLHNIVLAFMAGKKDISDMLMTLPTGEDLTKDEGVLVAPTLAEFNAALFMKQMTK